MQYVKAIQKKRNYFEKLLDEKILTKWQSEMDVSDELFQAIINTVIYHYHNREIKEEQKSKHYSDLDSRKVYKWHLDLGLQIEKHPEIFQKPKKSGSDKIEESICGRCSCPVCIGIYEDTLGAYFTFFPKQKGKIKENEEDEYLYDMLTEEIKTYLNKSENMDKAKQNCKCYNHVQSKLHEYLFKYIDYFPFPQKSNIGEILKSIEHKIQKDVQPNNKQIYNYNHPSLYCYADPKYIDNYDKANSLPLQWLPSDFIRVNEGKVKIASYINGLEDNDGIYSEIENIVTTFLPHFKIKIEKNSTFQAIIKFTKISLKPGQTYEGGKYHLEGMMGECIIGTGIYYINVENIAESLLRFRTNLKGDLIYPQNDEIYPQFHYGIDNSKTYLTTLGEIEAKTDMCVVFPNIFQHKIEPFALADKTKPGERLVMAIFLIQPIKKILSTTDIPKQYDHRTYEEAQMFRELMMSIKGQELDDQNIYFEKDLNLCEH